MKKYLDNILLVSISFLLTFLISCLDDPGLRGYENVPEGLPSTISLKVSSPKMKVMTRDAGIDPDSDQASTIHDLWIGIFSKSTGKKTGEIFLTEDDIITKHSEREIEVLDVKVESGLSYVVGVANMQGFRGLDTDNGKELTNLQSLLAETQDWEAFKRIGGIMSNPLSTQRMGNIFMSGNYSEKGDSGNEDLDDNNNPEPVTIKPGEQVLQGVIHLQRVVAYNKFVLIPHEAITFTPVSWQVINVPGMSYIHNRTKGDRLNASDNPMNEGVTFWSGYDDDGNSLNKSYYHNSTPSTDFDNIFETEQYKNKENYFIDSFFDFYLLENKHTGIISQENEDGDYYNEREREFKLEESGKNSGWYKSLVNKEGNEIPAAPSTSPDLKNNNATYVVLKANLDYYYRVDDPNRDPVVPGPQDDLVKDYIHRLAEVTYSIHLGYCEGQGLNKANDFNCRRNTSYTYNVLIGGAGSIRIEVETEDERQPGMEGVVTDVMSHLVDLDAHYGEFNIALSDRQRKNLIWRITAPYEDRTVDMIRGSKNERLTTNAGVYFLDNRSDMIEALPNNQFYNWVQIRPTLNENILAHYPGDPRLIGREIGGEYPTKEASSEGGSIFDYARSPEDRGVWYLEALRNAEAFPHPYSHSGLNQIEIESYRSFLQGEYATKEEEEAAFADLNKNVQKALMEPHYFTIFIDEYVYEYKMDENKSSLTGDLMEVDGNSNAWRTYVNNDNRKLWLSLDDFEISLDFESAYSHSIYLISQRSIQTYYNSSAPRALGLEHINETFYDEAIGHWPWNGNNYDEADGLINIYNYIITDEWRNSWYRILYDGNNDFGADKNGIPNDYNEWTNHIAYGKDPNNIGEYLLRYVPNTYNQETLACMSRNRDLNNNNVVEPFEIRWFLPTAQTYTRIALGSSSLATPLFQPKNFSPSAITAGVGTLTSHYISSDNKMFWAEEVASVSVLNPNNWKEKVVFAGNLRCIRNLGQELYLTPGSEAYKAVNVSPAYTLLRNENIIYMEFYRSGALRNEITAQPIPVHVVSDMASLPTRKFQFDTSDYRVDGDIYTSIIDEKEKEKRDYSDWWEKVEEMPKILNKPGWRVPNVSELATMLYSGVLDPNLVYISCTYEYFNNRNEYYNNPNDNGKNYGPKSHYILGVQDGQITAGIKIKERGAYVRLVRDIE